MPGEVLRSYPLVSRSPRISGEGFPKRSSILNTGSFRPEVVKAQIGNILGFADQEAKKRILYRYLYNKRANIHRFY